MRQLILLPLLFAYLVGFLKLNPAAAFGPVTKVEVTHAHHHDDDHHHHLHSEKHEQTQETSSQKQHGETPHSHEIFVGSQVVLPPSLPTSVALVPELKSLFFVLAELPHQGPALFGIFRPPIV